MLDLADRVKQKLGEAAVVLGGANGGKVALVASFTAGAVERGLSASTVIREAAEVIGGGGGGRDDVAQAGGRHPERLDEAIGVARQAIERGLGGS
jgi:alanyl-tRNA synthetase